MFCNDTAPGTLLQVVILNAYYPRKITILTGRLGSNTAYKPTLQECLLYPSFSAKRGFVLQYMWELYHARSNKSSIVASSNKPFSKARSKITGFVRKSASYACSVKGESPDVIYYVTSRAAPVFPVVALEANIHRLLLMNRQCEFMSASL